MFFFEKIESFNRILFLKINASSNTPSWVIDVAIIIADYLIYIIPVLLCVLWLWGDNTKRRLALLSCFVTFFGLGINQLIILFYQHPRPFMIGLGHTWLTHSADFTFPSDHATVFASVALSLLCGQALLKGLATLAIGLCVAWARVFLGVHFPFDMLGAFGVSAFSYGVIAPIWKLIGNPCTKFTENCYRRIMMRPIALGLFRR